MRIEVKVLTSNELIVDACRTTVWKEGLGHEPSEQFVEKMYTCEHSPIRNKMFKIDVYDIPSFVATHFARHHEGVEKFISTCRDDRIDYKNGKLPDRNTPVNMTMVINAQALLNIAKVRLCHAAHPETVKVMKAIKEEIAKIDKPLADRMVKICVYRRACPEGNWCCGYVHTPAYAKEREAYDKLYGFVLPGDKEGK